MLLRNRYDITERRTLKEKVHNVFYWKKKFFSSDKVRKGYIHFLAFMCGDELEKITISQLKGPLYRRFVRAWPEVEKLVDLIGYNN